MGHTFHAYAFLRNQEDNKIFQEVFKLALSEIAPHELANLNNYISTLQRSINTEKDTKKIKAAIDGIAAIWNKYQTV